MSVFYRIRKETNTKSAFYGKFYGRAVHLGTIDTNGLAEIIQRNCSMKKSDVVAVLTEMVEVMTDSLQNSMRVRLDGFGTFKIGLQTSPADSAEEFTPTNNVKGMKVNFQPILSISADGTRSKVFLQGATVEHLPEYDFEEIAAETEG